MRPIFDTEADVPAQDKADYIEHEGKFHYVNDVKAVTEAAKFQTAVNEKKEQKRQKDEAIRERDDLKRQLEGKETGVDETKRAAWVKPVEDRAIAAEARAEKAESDLKTERVQARSLVLLDGLMIPERFQELERDYYVSFFDWDATANKLVVLDAPKGNPTATKPEDFAKIGFKKLKEHCYKADVGDGSADIVTNPLTGTPATPAATRHASEIRTAF